MKHSNRMFLIPEELYQHFFSTQQNQDGSPLGHIQSKMQHLAAPIDQKMNRDERAIRFDQEYKRYSKLQKEQEEKPLNVRLQNIEEIADSLPQKVEKTLNSAIIAPTKKTYHRRKTGKFSKTLKKGAKTESVSVFDDDNGEEEEEDEIYEDAKGQKEASTSGADPFVARKKRANDYVARNLASLGLNSHGQVMVNTAGGVPQVIKTSNVSTIIDHLVNNGGNRRKPLPPGYEKFVERINRHPELIKILGLKQQRHQSGSGMTHIKKTYKDERKYSSFKFKPTLWK
jgi:hypothetical protein